MLDFQCLWRRERDSNPRYVSVRRFSRPLQSTTLPSLLVLHMMDNLQCECGGFPKASAKLREIFVLAKFSFDFFVVACYFVCFSAFYLSTPLPPLIGLLRPLAISPRTKGGWQWMTTANRETKPRIGRLLLGNENKKSILFCIALSLHYLCTL